MDARELKLVLQSAVELARDMASEHVDTGHLLLALLRNTGSAPSRILAVHGVSFDRAKQTIAEFASPTDEGEQ